jgi:phosphatidylethanolamine-binding protein (PEBP) family uncharacterized protein
MLKLFLTVAAVAVSLVPAHAGDFSLQFNWGDTPACATGQPGNIANPAFIIANVPPGTRVLEFRMIDLNVPSFKHGGGNVKYSGQTVIEPGAFTYLGPCPPKGQHRYAWTLTAKNNAGLFGRVLGATRAVRSFP